MSKAVREMTRKELIAEIDKYKSEAGLQNIKNRELVMQTYEMRSRIDRLKAELQELPMRYRAMGNSNTTVNNCRRFLSAFFTWMRRSKIVTENPCESVEKYKEISKPIEH